MLAHRLKTLRTLSILLLIGGCVGTDRPHGAVPAYVEAVRDSNQAIADRSAELTPLHSNEPAVKLVAHQSALSIDNLPALEQLARDNNPRLTRLFHEYEAAVAKSQYADKMPDPRFGANVFGNPIQTASGSQRANMTFSQAIPWLARLRAEQQQAVLDAYAIHAELEAEVLRVEATLRSQWYRLYVLDKQIEIAEANQELLKSLIAVANAKIATGTASQGDVLLGTLELSKLEERLLTYRRQREGTVA